MFDATVDYIYQVTFPPFEKDNIIKHNHSCYELVYFIEGTGETTINSTETIKYSANKYVIYKPFAYHDEKHHTRTHVKGFGFTIASDHVLAPESGLYEDKSKTILQLLDWMYEERNRKRPLYEVVIDSYLCNLLATHYRSLNSHFEKKSAMKNVIAYLDENYLQHISIQELADMSGYSYDRFRHIFKETMGVSPKNYISHKRIGHAKRLLKDKEISITEIAYLCGFSSASEFDNAFKRRIGVTPLQYRKEQAFIQNGTDTLEQIVANDDEK